MTLSDHPSAPDLEQRLRAAKRPACKPVMFQRWKKLLFLHWSWDPEQLQALLPPGLFIDCWDDRAWLGVVPFYMRKIRPVWSPSVPGVSNFLELNVRTYVYDAAGRPGVWFISLDANQPLAVILARRFFSLPYVHAKMRAETDHDWVTYHSQRPGIGSTSEFCYRGQGEERIAEPGSFEFFLVERYLLFAWHVRKQRLFSGQVFHKPYPIRDAEVVRAETDLMPLNALESPAGPPEHRLFSEGVDVEVFGLKPQAS